MNHHLGGKQIVLNVFFLQKKNNICTKDKSPFMRFTVSKSIIVRKQAATTIVDIAKYKLAKLPPLKQKE